MEKVGKGGRHHGRGGQSLDTQLEVVEGMQFDRGYLSAYFVTAPTAWRRCSRRLRLIHERISRS